MQNTSKKASKFLINLIIQLYVGLGAAIESLLPDGPGKDIWLSTLEPGQKIANAMTDADPNDKEQILQIAKDYANQDVIPLAHEQLLERFEKIENQNIKNLAIMATNIPFTIARIHTDKNPQNLYQTQTYLEEFVESVDNQKLILDGALDPLLERLFKRQSWLASMFISTIKAKLSDTNFDFNKDGK